MTKPSVLITGGSGKIGRCLIERLLVEGWRVIFTGIRETSRDKMLAEFGEATASGDLVGYLVDLERESAAAELCEQLSRADEHPVGLVNNARSRENLFTGGGNTPSRNQWVNEFLVNVVAAYELSFGLAEQKNSQLKSIVNVGSIYGMVAVNHGLYEDPADIPPAHYGVCKAALVQMTRELAVRLAGQSVRVNTVSFGGVEGRVSDAFMERYGKLCPSGAMLREDDIAGHVSYLLSDNSMGMTGHNMVVDGGWTSW